MYSAVLLGGMVVLAAWAIANICLWLHKRQTTQGSRSYFWHMNALWNLVNLTIASASSLLIMARLQAYNSDPGLQNLQIRIVAYNILADLLYIACGFALERYGKKHSKGRLDGYGQAIALQGAFLLCFDSILASCLIIVSM